MLETVAAYQLRDPQCRHLCPPDLRPRQDVRNPNPLRHSPSSPHISLLHHACWSLLTQATLISVQPESPLQIAEFPADSCDATEPTPTHKQRFRQEFLKPNV